MTQKTITLVETKTLTKQDNDTDFIDEMCNQWLNQISIWESDVYIISYNGCKFDMQFLYKS